MFDKCKFSEYECPFSSNGEYCGFPSGQFNKIELFPCCPQKDKNEFKKFVRKMQKKVKSLEIVNGKIV